MGFKSKGIECIMIIQKGAIKELLVTCFNKVMKYFDSGLFILKFHLKSTCKFPTAKMSDFE